MAHFGTHHDSRALEESVGGTAILYSGIERARVRIGGRPARVTRLTGDRATSS